MSYKEKLIQFNSTGKYKSEMEFMRSILAPKEGEVILDYGCGIGTMVNYIGCIGHDIHQYFDPQPEWFRPSIYFQMDKVFFMHSLAHLYNPREILNTLKGDYLKENGMIYVITPNADWLRLKNKGKEYKSDETVNDHFTLDSLLSLFSEFKVVNFGQFGEQINGVNERLFLIAKK